MTLFSDGNTLNISDSLCRMVLTISTHPFPIHSSLRLMEELLQEMLTAGTSCRKGDKKVDWCVGVTKSHHIFSLPKAIVVKMKQSLLIRQSFIDKHQKCLLKALGRKKYFKDTVEKQIQGRH